MYINRQGQRRDAETGQSNQFDFLFRQSACECQHEAAGSTKRNAFFFSSTWTFQFSRLSQRPLLIRELNGKLRWQLQGHSVQTRELEEQSKVRANHSCACRTEGGISVKPGVGVLCGSSDCNKSGTKDIWNYFYFILSQKTRVTVHRVDWPLRRDLKSFLQRFTPINRLKHSFINSSGKDKK